MQLGARQKSVNIDFVVLPPQVRLGFEVPFLNVLQSQSHTAIQT
ncbi:MULTISPECIES: hypothetical protein [Staphylococcus]|nr:MULTISPECIES: hypothetical protein [Staphylococcus]MDH9599002.1 hypothetical protein [Staphylococcus capitis]MDH9622636.1 hypothetical protein [Staphylococcus capitis]MDS3982241.1 hypothetical protein [Staphylococcus capitis]